LALKDYLNGPQYLRQIHELQSQMTALQERYDQMQGLAKKYGAMEALEIQRHIEQENAKLESVRLTTQSAEKGLAVLAHQTSELRGQILVIEETLLLESFALYLPKFKLNASHEYKTRLDSVRERQKAMIKNGEAATGDMDWQVNGSKAEGRKLVNDMLKLVIRSFNNEADYCVDNVKFDNIELGAKRIRQSFDTCNRLGRVMTVKLAEGYLNLKLDELHLAHEFQIKKQEEKEEAKRVREELREQQKLEQEIRAAREKITKERKHFAAALRDLNARLEKVDSEEERLLLLVKIAEVEAGKANLDSEEKAIDYREQNAKAGYVYVISNIGAFGEGVYKIGMTRRLEPMERVDELGDASVPFWFDVHAMVFSDNAPALEAKLHERLAAGRLNKVNGRKEFFRADIAEIESIIRVNYDAVAEVTHEAAAEQYRESMRMTMPKSEIQQADRAAAFTNT
jgi:Domain of unknown function (DUF4041)/T5orf172 domain